MAGFYWFVLSIADKFAISHIFLDMQVFLAIMTKFLSVDPFHFYPCRCGPVPKVMDMVDNKEKEDGFVVLF